MKKPIEISLYDSIINRVLKDEFIETIFVVKENKFLHYGFLGIRKLDRNKGEGFFYKESRTYEYIEKKTIKIGTVFHLNLIYDPNLLVKIFFKVIPTQAIYCDNICFLPETYAVIRGKVSKIEKEKDRFRIEFNFLENIHIFPENTPFINRFTNLLYELLVEVSRIEYYRREKREELDQLRLHIDLLVRKMRHLSRNEYSKKTLEYLLNRLKEYGFI